MVPVGLWKNKDSIEVKNRRVGIEEHTKELKNI